jgi:pSer/pThr/pTyr-binding forkhead associated (FHA) protein
MKAKLVVTSKDRQTAQEVPFDRPSITIGRKPSNDLAFNRPEISGSHAAFLFENNQYFVMDLGSTNGTLLNGAQLVAREKYGLQDKDVITVAPYAVQFIVEEESMDTMIEVPSEQTPGQKKIRSGTAPDLGSARIPTGTEDQAREAARPPAAAAPPPRVEAPPAPAPAAVAQPQQQQPAPLPQVPVSAPQQIILPESKKTPSAVTDYLWLGIGAILVLAAIGLIIFILVGL